jgi:hypothetical protein
LAISFYRRNVHSHSSRLCKASINCNIFPEHTVMWSHFADTRTRPCIARNIFSTSLSGTDPPLHGSSVSSTFSLYCVASCSRDAVTVEVDSSHALAGCWVHDSISGTLSRRGTYAGTCIRTDRGTTWVQYRSVGAVGREDGGCWVAGLWVEDKRCPLFGAVSLSLRLCIYCWLAPQCNGQTAVGWLCVR